MELFPHMPFDQNMNILFEELFLKILLWNIANYVFLHFPFLTRQIHFARAFQMRLS